jgi:competence protein ComEC
MSTDRHLETLSLPVKIFYGTCIALVLGVAVGTLSPLSWPTLIFIAGLAIVSALLWRRTSALHEAGQWLCLTLVLLGFVVGAGRTLQLLETFGQSALADQVGQEVTLTGMVVREPDRREAVQYLTIKTETEGDLIRVGTERHLPIAYGDTVTVTGVLEVPASFVTELGRTFNYPGYLLARGIEYQLSFTEVTVVASGGGNSVLDRLYTLKTAFIKELGVHLAEPAAGLGAGLLLGVKQSLGEQVEADFRQTGIIHIVVLSGYNIMLIVAFVMYALALFLPLRPRVFMGLIAIILFAMMVGLSATVVRASIMAGILLLAQAFGRSYVILRGLLFAAVVMLLHNPLLLIFDIGFQLSFMATLGLVLLIPQLERWFGSSSWLAPVQSFFYATLATQLAVLPLLLYHIGEVSLVAVVVNVLVLPMVPVAMGLTFLVGASGLIGSSFASFIAVPAFYSLEYIIVIAKWFAALPFAAVVVPEFSITVVIAVYTGTAYLLWRYRHTAWLHPTAEFGEGALLRALGQQSGDTLSAWTIVEESDEGLIQENKKADTKTAPHSKKAPPSDLPVFFR